MGKRSTDAPLFNCLRCGKPLTSRPQPGRKYCSRECAGNTKHGLTGTKENYIWREMRKRCRNPNNKDYPKYGGRGIKVCERWDDFQMFLDDIGPRPGPTYTIDRYPNGDGNYEPGNVRWATKKEQAQNRRGCATPEQDEELRKLHATGLNFAEIGRILGRPVRAAANRLGLKANFNPHAPRRDYLNSLAAYASPVGTPND